MNEHRTSRRVRVLKTGSIEVSSGSAIDCVIRNLSKTGAALEVASPLGIPEEFVLSIPADYLKFQCRVVWRKPTRIGVRFAL